MKHIKCTRSTSYSLGGDESISFDAGEVYSVGRKKDVPDQIAYDMISNHQAVPFNKPVEETKIVEPEELKSSEVADYNEMTSKADLEAYAREHCDGLELDRRKSIKTLKAQIKEALNE